MIENISNYSTHALDESARLLTKAFLDDPLFQYALPAEGTREQSLFALLKLNLKYGMMFGRVYAEHKKGLAIWLPPGKTSINFVQAVRAGMWLAPFKVGLEAVRRLGDMAANSERLHERFAPDPHWYLFMLGVEPGCQRTGLGGMLLQPVLAEADRTGLPCYLETNNPSAVPFYERHGFKTMEVHHSVSSGLCFWALRREKRTGM